MEKKRNLWVIPTDKPSGLYLGNNGNFVFGMMQTSIQSGNDDFTNQNIYITNLEEIKEGDLCLNEGDFDEHIIFKADSFFFNTGLDAKKIILTTDSQLIANGVQAIDDYFLEWFVKNTSCENVEVRKEKYSERFDNDKSAIGNSDTWGNRWVIIISKEEPKQDRTCTNNCSVVCGECQIFEPKQETLEEDCKRIKNELDYSEFDDTSFRLGVKWQQEQDKKMYSEGDMKKAFYNGYCCENKLGIEITFNEWFEQFKNK